MDGIYFAFGNIAVCIVIYWAVVNDHRHPTSGTVGWLAMPDDSPDLLAAPARVSDNRPYDD